MQPTVVYICPGLSEKERKSVQLYYSTLFSCHLSSLHSSLHSRTFLNQPNPFSPARSASAPVYTQHACVVRLRDRPSLQNIRPLSRAAPAASASNNNSCVVSTGVHKQLPLAYKSNGLSQQWYDLQENKPTQEQHLNIRYREHFSRRTSSQLL